MLYLFSRLVLPGHLYVTVFRKTDQIVILGLFVNGFTKTVPISTRNEIQFIADY